ncbi:MAG TPA: hypothetical protein PLV92_25300, partial [Pirellulaceae bacterium]|nr:hypothetical protein [Pirellulaceae bacterium]
SVWGDRVAVAAWLVAMLLVVTGVWGRLTGGAKSFGLGQRADWFAHAAARFAGRSDFPKTALVAHFGQSAVFTYHNGPNRKVFVDGRLEVCTQATVARHERILDQMVRGDRQWEEEHLAEFGELPLVLLDRRDARPQIEALVSSGTWRLIYADRTAALFLELDLAKRLGVPAENPSVLGLTGPIVRPTIRPDRK